MSLLKRLFYAPFVAFNWVKLLDFASKQEFNLANELIVKLKPFLEEKNIEYNIMKGYLEFATDRDEESVVSFIKALNLLKSSRKYSENEKNYLKCYILSFINHINEYKTLDEIIKVDIGTNICDSIDISMIPDHLKSKFPLR